MMDASAYQNLLKEISVWLPMQMMIYVESIKYAQVTMNASIDKELLLEY
jgi:hypothetical protein